MREVAKVLNIPYSTVEKVMKSFFNFVKFRISKVPYKKLKTFDKIKTNFVIPGFGKLVVKNKVNRKIYEEKYRKTEC